MRAAQIEGGFVVNVIEVESLDFLPGLVDAAGAEIGDSWDGNAFSRPTHVPSVQEFSDAVQDMLDAKAKAKGYDNIVSACSYAGAENQFQGEGVSFVKWRGDVWAACYTILGAVQAGQRAIPTISGLLSELPEIVL